MKSDEEVERLVTEYLPLVKSIAIRSCWSGCDEASVLSAAYAGLIEAVQKHDDDLASLKTFVQRTVKYRIADYIRSIIGRSEVAKEKRGALLEFLPLDSVVSKDGRPVAEVVADENAPDVPAVVSGLESARGVHGLIARAPFTDNEDMMLKLYFFEGKTMDEIGPIFGVSGSRVHQILASALHKLRGCAKGDFEP